MNKIFFTADTHFGSEIALKYTWSRRIFKDVNEMDGAIIHGWNKAVDKDDTVYHLGDFAHKDMPYEKQKEYFDKLNGNICIIRGNHDLLPFEKYGEMGFKMFSDLPLLLKPLLNEHQNFYLCHYPVERHSHYYTLTGHIHEKWRVAKNMLNVGVDVSNFKPLSLEDVMFCVNAEAGGHWDANVYPDAPIQWRYKVTMEGDRDIKGEPTRDIIKKEMQRKKIL